MKNFLTEKSNYDKLPVVPVKGYSDSCWVGWSDISGELKRCNQKNAGNRNVIVVECYTGVHTDSLLSALVEALSPDRVFLSADAMWTEDYINRMVYPDVTDDEVFGYLTRLQLADFFDKVKLAALKDALDATTSGTILVYGTGASLITKGDIFIYADMPRWEGQLRFRRNEVSNLGASNKDLKASLQYKRAFFVDWRVCDRYKKTLTGIWNYILDTVHPDETKMVTAEALANALKQVTESPFRVVPFFDPGPWGGQWMKEVCDLDRSANNYAWCFDCVPEENSLLLRFGAVDFESPASNVVFFEPKRLLGEAVHGRFGDEFPIRFDLLDTMGGGNLSLQVHPLTEYIQEHFGMHYTQDESYYMLETGEDAIVYLGLENDIDPEAVIKELQDSRISGKFDAEKHVAKWPVKKHDHILIPAGTVHCSGADSVVLEISATPYIFTFKLWDWGRMGMDGKPRPINIEHGKNVINWAQTTEKTMKELINTIEKVAEGEGWVEERTGLHEREFIETRRHWFTGRVTHHTRGAVNVLNLIEGREAIVESPSAAFEPFVVHYAETFIVPAAVGEYTIRPWGGSESRECATIKAYVRTQA